MISKKTLETFEQTSAYERILVALEMSGHDFQKGDISPVDIIVGIKKLTRLYRTAERKIKTERRRRLVAEQEAEQESDDVMVLQLKEKTALLEGAVEKLKKERRRVRQEECDRLGHIIEDLQKKNDDLYRELNAKESRGRKRRTK